MQLLGVQISREIPGGHFIWLKPQQPGGVSLAFQRVSDPSPHPGRLHIDTVVQDVAEARSEVEDLGGELVAEHEIMGFRWNVMADPEGNLFCIAQERHHAS